MRKMRSFSTALTMERNDKLIEEKTLKIDTTSIIQASMVIRAISHKLRCAILQLIHQEEFINVTDIYLKMGLEQTVVSQHLAILRQAGYVVTQREGKCIYYSINYQRLHTIHKLVNQLTASK